MAYFANGAEGEDAEERYCRRCVHDDVCPVWLLHMCWNYEACNPTTAEAKAKHEALNALWPEKDGVNGQCKMFFAKGGA
jgi:hypothetical protein